MGNKHMKRYSHPLVIRIIQTASMVRYHSKPTQEAMKRWATRIEEDVDTWKLHILLMEDSLTVPQYIRHRVTM